MHSGLVGRKVFFTRREDRSARNPPRVIHHQVYNVYEVTNVVAVFDTPRECALSTRQQCRTHLSTC